MYSILAPTAESGVQPGCMSTNVPEPHSRALLLDGARHPVKGCGAVALRSLSFSASLCRNIVRHSQVPLEAEASMDGGSSNYFIPILLISHYTLLKSMYRKLTYYSYLHTNISNMQKLLAPTTPPNHQKHLQ